MMIFSQNRGVSENSRGSHNGGLKRDLSKYLSRKEERAVKMTERSIVVGESQMGLMLDTEETPVNSSIEISKDPNAPSKEEGDCLADRSPPKKPQIGVEELKSTQFYTARQNIDLEHNLKDIFNEFTEEKFRRNRNGQLTAQNKDHPHSVKTNIHKFMGYNSQNSSQTK